jgi:4'-phosphopantetheinyl transferase
VNAPRSEVTESELFMDLEGELENGRPLEDGQVLIWTTALDCVAEARYGQLAALLSRDENQRSVRFRFERDRKRFTVCRGVLREILGTYLQTDPAKLVFSYGPQGKPHLKIPNERPLHFNVAHSLGWAIYALGFGEVGVDLELLRPLPELQALVDQCFSAGEVSAFYSIPPALRLRAFFSCWTRKEAYVKACGGGLLIPLDQFDVSVDPGLPACLVSVRGIPGAHLPWTLFSFDPWTDSVAALVCPRHSKPCLCGSWPYQSATREKSLLGEASNLVPPSVIPPLAADH